jgi:hypothetical protein
MCCPLRKDHDYAFVYIQSAIDATSDKVYLEKKKVLTVLDGDA